MRSPRIGSGRGWKGGVVLLLAVQALACGGDDGLAVDPAIAPFVGDWNATSVVLTSVANPDVHPDLMDFGATFTLNVQPSGQYTAILLVMGQSSTEIGRIEVSGSTIVQHRDFPSPGTFTGTFAFPDSDHLVLDGDTEFDFNQDGTDEAARAHMEFVRR